MATEQQKPRLSIGSLFNKLLPNLAAQTPDKNLAATFDPSRPINVLFYLEPLIFICQPYLYNEWTNLWGRITETLDQNTQYKFCYKLITSEPLAELASQREIANHAEIIPVTQEEVLEPFNYLAMDAGISWYKETYSQEQLNAATRVYAEKLGGWQPDIIISSSHVPFLKTLFPQAVIYHFEVGMTSRPPFGHSYYLDPLGLYKHGTLFKKAADIRSWPIQPEEKRLVGNYRDIFVHLIRVKNPFREYINTFRGKFKYILLLPLQVEGCWGSGNCDFITNFQFVHMVMSKIDPQIGVVVTLHPSDNWMTPDNEAYFKKKFPNFIYFPEINKVNAASQYFMGSVDGVLAVSTMVGLQTLIWQKRLFVIGESQLTVAEDASFKPDLSDLHRLPRLLDKPPVEKDQILFWLLTHFYIPEKYFFDPTWLSEHLVYMTREMNAGRASLAAFKPIDDPAALFDQLITDVRVEIPIMNGVPPSAPIGDHDARQKMNREVDELCQNAAWRALTLRAWNEAISFRNGENRQLLIQGWSHSETNGVWADGPSAGVVISLPNHPAQDVMATCDVYAFLPDQNPTQLVDVYANLEKVGCWVFELGKNNPDVKQVLIPTRLIDKDHPMLHLTFDFPNAVSPAEVGYSADPRRLSMGLSSIRLEVRE